jgi:CubicO group peptidase (beta-lactamase class C family)
MRHIFLVGLAIAFHSRLLATDFSELRELAAAELRRTATPGCAVAVVAGGETVFCEGFGVANVDTGEAVRAEMLFRLGSTTKMFTAATLVSLAEEGKVRLDAPIGESLPGLAPKLAQVTPHQLLTHTAGLTDYTVMEGPHDEAALAANARSLKDDLIFEEPGKIYSYSNPGYWLAGLVTEVAGGKRYADLVLERVLAPCGLVRSTFRPTVAMTWPLAVGHGPEGPGKPFVIRPLADNAAGWPAGQLFSSAPELAGFCAAFMKGGVLPRAVVEKLSTPHIALPDGERHYGYGLGVRDVGGLRWLSHNGSRAGYGSHMRLCPERKFAVIILCNKTGENLPRVAEKAVQLVLGLAPPPREPREKVTLGAEEMQRLAGTYRNGSSTVVLRIRDGQLISREGTTLTAIGENRLARSGAANTPETEFTVVRGADGRAEYLVRQGRALKRVR